MLRPLRTAHDAANRHCDATNGRTSGKPRCPAGSAGPAVVDGHVAATGGAARGDLDAGEGFIPGPPGTRQETRRRPRPRTPAIAAPIRTLPAGRPDQIWAGQRPCDPVARTQADQDREPRAALRPRGRPRNVLVLVQLGRQSHWCPPSRRLDPIPLS